MVWELLTNASDTTTFPSTDDIYVRFLFHNGTTSNISEPVAYPLFGGNDTIIPWDDFVTGTSKFAIATQSAWCEVCGNTTGVCASTTTTSSSSSATSSSSSSSHHGGMSNAVAGVIGAMVTLAVILGVELLILLVAGLRIVNKKRLTSTNGAPTPASSGAVKA